MSPSKVVINACVVALLLAVQQTWAHSRWICPKPRSSDSGLKVGSCGGVGSITDASIQTTLAPGPFTVYFQETVFHRGAPFRIALSVPGQDNYESCVLLDHIPHFDGGAANRIYGITVTIPDIDCSNCALQLIQFMTDKVAGQCTFNPADTTNFANGQCGSNYFSCANVKITGSKAFSSSLCRQPTGFAQGYLYKSNEAAEWNGLYLASGDRTTITPVPGICSTSQDTNTDEKSPTASDNTAAIVSAGAVVGLALGFAVFVVKFKRRQRLIQAAAEKPIVDTNSIQRPMTNSNPNFSLPPKPRKPANMSPGSSGTAYVQLVDVSPPLGMRSSGPPPPLPEV